MNWLRCLFCLHDWRENGHQDYANLGQALWRDDGSRLRVTWFECSKCGKRRSTERLIGGRP